MTVARLQLCPPPAPRLLDEATAAAYLGIGKSFFRTLWERERRVPAPIRVGKRQLWDRKLLDRYVDALSGLAPASDGWDDF